MRLPPIRGLAVDICIDGKPLPEYDDPKSESPILSESTRYVEAVSGAKFGLSFAAVSELGLQDNERLACAIVIDGENIGVHHVWALQVGGSPSILDSRSYRTAGGTTYKQPLRFQEVVYGTSMSLTVLDMMV